MCMRVLPFKMILARDTIILDRTSTIEPTLSTNGELITASTRDVITSSAIMSSIANEGQ